MVAVLGLTVNLRRAAVLHGSPYKDRHDPHDPHDHRTTIAKRLSARIGRCVDFGSCYFCVDWR